MINLHDYEQRFMLLLQIYTDLKLAIDYSAVGELFALLLNQVNLMFVSNENEVRSNNTNNSNDNNIKQMIY